MSDTVRPYVIRPPAEDGSVTFHYLPTWTTDLDSGGIFHLVVEDERRGGSRILSVRAEGSSSRRWFAVDRIKDAKAVEQLLVQAFRESR